MKEEITQEVVDIAPETTVSGVITPNKISYQKKTIQQIDIYSDETWEEQPKTKKQRLEDTYLEFCKASWHSTIEEWYVSMKWTLANKQKLTREDEIMIKLLNTVATDLWYNDNNKEFVIWTNIKKLSQQQMLNR